MSRRLTRNLEAFSATFADEHPTITWWCGGIAALLGCAALAWVAILFEPQDLISLGKQMIALLAFVVCLAAALWIGASSEEGANP